MSWVPLLDHRNQWLQVYLGNELTWVTGVATQGKKGKRKAWVKKFLLRYWGARVRVQYYKGHGDIHAKVGEIENEISLEPSTFNDYNAHSLKKS